MPRPLQIRAPTWLSIEPSAMALMVLPSPIEDPTKNGLLKRSLVVTDQDLVPDREWDRKNPVCCWLSGT
jgi:hypothetical protein